MLAVELVELACPSTVMYGGLPTTTWYLPSVRMPG